jgi:glycosyltransferase involved in cell wall biosynthesis
MIKVALLTTDSREHFKDYRNPQPYFGTAPQALLEGFIILPDEVEIHVISCLQEAPISSPTQLGANIYYHALSVPKIGWMRTCYQGCVRAVRRKLREIKPDVVHGQGTERDCAISAVCSGFPSVITLHGVMGSVRKTVGAGFMSYYGSAAILESIAIRRAERVICISDFVRRVASPAKEKARLVPNAVREMFLSDNQTKSRRSGPARILNIGSIYPLKRQLEILRALVDLRSTIAFEAYFVGCAKPGDSYAAEFFKLLNHAHAAYSGFRHVDRLDDPQLLRTFDDADALLHFSQEESFGLIFSEAQARGLTIFAADVGAVREITRGNERCQIFPAGNLAEATARLADWIREEHHLQAKDMPKARLLSEPFSTRKVAEQHLEVYRELASAKRQTRH